MKIGLSTLFLYYRQSFTIWSLSFRSFFDILSQFRKSNFLEFFILVMSILKQFVGNWFDGKCCLRNSWNWGFWIGENLNGSFLEDYNSFISFVNEKYFKLTICIPVIFNIIVLLNKMKCLSTSLRPKSLCNWTQRFSQTCKNDLSAYFLTIIF